jgi:hypothetical protein
MIFGLHKDTLFKKNYHFSIYIDFQQYTNNNINILYCNIIHPFIYYNIYYKFLCFFYLLKNETAHQ